MKIHKLRFKNLNSLVGEWSIDFTNQEYMEQGIFAITGQTGAGKSTILDAICLALYGQTPRLDKISQVQNDIMSRHTGECFAELDFSTKDGLYRCYWSQNRARKNPKGKLQVALHEIIDLKTQKPIEAQLRTVALKVVEITGMDFEHFTRAMLLAQGQFAKFLQATPDERSPILEQITGTAIYTQISMNVHARKSQEEKNLELINTELSGVNILTDEEELDLNNKLLNIDSELGQIVAKIEQVAQQILWIKKLDELLDKKKSLTTDLQTLEEAKELFKIEAGKLETAKIALEINTSIYSKFINTREQLQVYQLDLKKHQQELPILVDKNKNHVAELSTKTQTFDIFKLDKAAMLEIIEKVNNFDFQIENIRPLIETNVQKIEGYIKQIQGETNKQKECELEQDKSQKQLEGIQEYIRQYTNDGELVQSLSGITEQLSTFEKYCNELSIQYTNLENTQNSYNILMSQQTNYKDNKAEKYAILEQYDTKRQPLMDEHQQLIKDGDLIVLVDFLKDLRDKYDNITKLYECTKKIKEHEIKRTTLETAIEGYNTTSTDLSAKLTNINDNKTNINKLIESLQQQIILENKVYDLENERQQLHDGNPCPLCGSIEHPYVSDIPFIASKTENELKVAKAELKQFEDNYNNTLQQHAQIVTTLKQSKKTWEEIKDDLTAQQQIANELIVLLELNIRVESIVAQEIQIKQQQLEAKIALDDMETKIKQINHLNNQIAEINKECKQEQDEIAKLEIELAGLKVKIEENKKSLTDKTLSIENQTVKIKTDKDELLKKLSCYGINESSFANVEEIPNLLQDRVKKWNAQQEQLTQIEKQINELSNTCGKHKLIIEQITIDKTELEQTLEDAKQQLNKLNIERQQLFSDKNTQEVKIELQKSFDKYEADVKWLDTKVNKSQEQVSNVTALIGQLQEIITPLQKTFIEQEQQFKQQIAKYEFVDEGNFCKSLITTDELEQLLNRQSQLKTQELKLITESELIKTQLIEEQQKQLTTENIEVLSLLRQQLDNQLSTLNQNIGSIKNRLDVNTNAHSECGKIIEKQQIQQKIAKKWGNLNELIGSHDGKKFRNFVQGVTFEMVVRNANVQLRTMSDRYLLIRDKTNVLELNVIDNYQAGEIRTTKNLSGGESFIISLALALGLSKIAGNKVQVDSLFLDEGFGTLDEDSLHTALDALSSLQQDGKLIGVISHVGALKERISLQINVETLNGGVSRISGIGCQQIS